MESETEQDFPGATCTVEPIENGSDLRVLMAGPMLAEALAQRDGAGRRSAVAEVDGWLRRYDLDQDRYPVRIIVDETAGIDAELDDLRAKMAAAKVLN